MIESTAYAIFKTRSRTFFLSSLFFPKRLRHDVFTLYSFVRTADDFVDSLPPRSDEFFSFKKSFETAYRNEKPSGQPLIDDFVALMRRTDISYAWIEAFFAAMTDDLSKKNYTTFEELEAYMYGSAEVIGLCMCKLIGLPTETHSEARSLGRAFQYINFIRDLAEDIALGRQYIPLETRKYFGFDMLSKESASKRPEQFARLIRGEIARYRSWQRDGKRGFRHIPRRFLIPIKTAAESYEYTAHKIERNPQIVFECAVKPSAPRLFLTLLGNILTT